MFEINFRSELLHLDKVGYELCPTTYNDIDENNDHFTPLDASDWTSRRENVLSHVFDGSLIPSSPSESRQRFASGLREERREALWHLFEVMKTWTCLPSMPELVHQAGFALAQGTMSSDDAIDRAEYIVVSHYISTFADYFQRSPVMPHRYM